MDGESRTEEFVKFVNLHVELIDMSTLSAPQTAGKICFLAGVSLRVVLGNFLIQIVSLGL